ncbi:MAG: hypothetical protein GF383_11635 [Candidatus Lokiarchaeota archaeon]|nr:hypothetical protein [Candidatus Lokiarchaeota archaeon]MBD3341403.1 hypothetical protein [Candidatus Lokiarchaeota archaeon]
MIDSNEKDKVMLKGKGITKLTSVPNQRVLERYKDLEQYRDIFYQCGKCGTCRTAYHDPMWSRVCPAGEFGKFEAYYLSGKNLLTWAVNTDKLKWTDKLAEIFYQCSLCLACTQQCQIPEIHHYAGEWLMAMREKAVEIGFGPMPEQKRYSDHIQKENNPYMERHQDRLNWVEDENTYNPKAKIAYFVGCTTSYREQNIAKATIKILNSIGYNYQILRDERCCGSPVYMTGQTQQAKQIADKNLKIFKDSGIEKIITSCAGCYRMLKEIYPKKLKINHDIKVLHTPEVLLDLLEFEDLKFKNNVNMKITYHDPCHIGRHMGIYKAPRDVLTNIPGIELIEMPRNKQNAWCCGSGGGVRSAFKDLSKFAANERIEEAQETGASALVSSCPFCKNQFVTHSNGSIEILDLVEIVAKAL